MPGVRPPLWDLLIDRSGAPTVLVTVDVVVPGVPVVALRQLVDATLVICVPSSNGEFTVTWNCAW